VATSISGDQHDPPSAARAASVEVHSNGFVTLPRSWTSERMLDGSDFFVAALPSHLEASLADNFIAANEKCHTHGRVGKCEFDFAPCRFCYTDLWAQLLREDDGTR